MTSELVCRCLLLGDAGTGAAVNVGVCCLVMPEQVMLVCCKCGWLLHRRLVVSAKACSKETKGDCQKTF